MIRISLLLCLLSKRKTWTIAAKMVYTIVGIIQLTREILSSNCSNFIIYNIIT